MDVGSGLLVGGHDWGRLFEATLGSVLLSGHGSELGSLFVIAPGNRGCDGGLLRVQLVNDLLLVRSLQSYIQVFSCHLRDSDRLSSGLILTYCVSSDVLGLLNLLLDPPQLLLEPLLLSHSLVQLGEGLIHLRLVVLSLIGLLRVLIDHIQLDVLFHGRSRQLALELRQTGQLGRALRLHVLLVPRHKALVVDVDGSIYSDVCVDQRLLLDSLQTLLLGGKLLARGESHVVREWFLVRGAKRKVTHVQQVAVAHNSWIGDGSASILDACGRRNYLVLDGGNLLSVKVLHLIE